MSRTLLNVAHAHTIPFSFAEGQELSEHASTQHALIQVLSGDCDFSLDGKWHRLKSGDFLYRPPNLRHAVKASQAFSILLMLAKPDGALKRKPTGVDCHC